MIILVTGASSAKAYQVMKRIAGEQVILGDYHDLPGPMLRLGKMVKLPAPFAPSYAHEMLTLCLDKEIGKIVVLNATEKEALLPARQLFLEYNILIDTADAEL